MGPRCNEISKEHMPPGSSPDAADAVASVVAPVLIPLLPWE